MSKPIFERAAGDDDSSVTNTNFVGFHTTAVVDNYLSLQALAERKTKSRMLRDLLAEYIATCDKEQAWVAMAAERAYHVWAARFKAAGMAQQTVDRFVEHMRRELKRQKLMPATIDAIVKEFKKHAKKDITADEAKD